MTDPLFRIVFEGQLLEGVSLEQAKSNLARLFNSDVHAIDRLFTGQPVALKQGLSFADAQRYLQALNAAGVQARLESEPAISLSLDKVETVQASRPAPEPENPSPYAPPKAQVDTQGPVGELKVFSLSGRIGRLRYLAWSLVLLAAMLPVMLIGALLSGFSDNTGYLLIVLASLATFVVGVPLGVQRLHDIGWSGWFMLLNLVPFVGSLFPFAMILLPGTQGPNAYGPPPPANSRAVKILAIIWPIAIILSITLALVGGISAFQALKQENQVTPGQYEQSLPGELEKNIEPPHATTGKFFKGDQSL